MASECLLMPAHTEAQKPCLIGLQPPHVYLLCALSILSARLQSSMQEQPLSAHKLYLVQGLWQACNCCKCDMASFQLHISGAGARSCWPHSQLQASVLYLSVLQEPEKPRQKRTNHEAASSDEEDSLNPAPPSWGAQKPNRNTFMHPGPYPQPLVMPQRSLADSRAAPAGPHRMPSSKMASPSPSGASSGMGSRLSKHLERQACPKMCPWDGVGVWWGLWLGNLVLMCVFVAAHVGGCAHDLEERRVVAIIVVGPMRPRIGRISASMHMPVLFVL